MKTNTIIKVSLSVVSLAIIAFVASTQHSADYVQALAQAVSYFAVLALGAITAFDYRLRSPKSVTGR